MILRDLHSGATICEACGPYDHKTRRLMDDRKMTDPGAFITVYSVSGINYTPKE